MVRHERYAHRRAVFLDRDGTLCRDVGYCTSPEAFELLPGVPEAIRMLNDAHWPVIVVTNQSGIARGLVTSEQLEAIHYKMNDTLRRAGAHIDAVYVCPHHPDDDCVCRKPKPGLLDRAAAEWNLWLSGSYVIGDQARDLQAGRAVGTKTVLVQTELASQASESTADHIASNLCDAVSWILRQEAASPR